MAGKNHHPAIGLRASRVAAARQARHWSQADLAARAGLSRPEISAIETGRVTPAVTAALALARALECPVEALFGAATDPVPALPAWAFPPPPSTDRRPALARYWTAEIAGRTWLYPSEPTALGFIPHDGILTAGRTPAASALVTACAEVPAIAADTLVIATCDPAVGVLAAAMREHTRGRLRLLPLMRSSAAALGLLARGLVHAAGVHMAPAGRPQANVAFARVQLGSQPVELFHVADWQTGVVLRDSGRFASAAAAARARLAWIGRDAGAGARRCLDELLGPDRRYPHLAPDHGAVATAVQCGFANAGVCPQLTAVEARLAFLPVHQEAYAVCLTADPRSDWRLSALVETLQSAAYRRRLSDLPGCRAAFSGRALT